MRPLFAVFALLSPITAFAVEAPYVPLVLQHQGRLLTNNDEPVDADLAVTVLIYDRAGDPPGQNPTPALWSETYQVHASKGVYTVAIGDTFGNRKALTEELLDSPDRFLAFKVDGGTEFIPRVRVGLAPYAFRAKQAAHARVADLATEATHAAAADLATNATHADAADAATRADAADLAADASKLGGLAPSAYAPAGGTQELVTVGTITAGTWHGAPVADAYVASAAAWNGKLAQVAVSAPITGTGREGTPLAIAKADVSTDGFLAKADWVRFDAAARATADTTFIRSQDTADQDAKIRISGNVQAARLSATATTGAPITVTSTTRVDNLNADTVDGMHFGQVNDAAKDMKAYFDKTICELHEGTYGTDGVCDPNLVVGTGTWSATACPTGYRVCTVPEVMRRAPMTTITPEWYWAAHEADDPASGNLDRNASRYSFPYCPSGSDAPLVRVNTVRGKRQVTSVICYTSGYTPLCCR